VQGTDCWFDEPTPGDRRSWAAPAAHGTYQGVNLELLDPHDEHELAFLFRAQHLEWEEAFESGQEILNDADEPTNPRLHIILHVVIANQLLADDPPETWQTVQRLAALGYDWHNVMHLIMGPASESVYRTLAQQQPFDRADYVRQLAELPGDWPSPEELGPH
jgi:Domain of unknown function (DUF1841)